MMRDLAGNQSFTRIYAEGFLRWTTLRGGEGARLQIADASYRQSVQHELRNY